MEIAVKVPVTVVTGILGSGKTTFVRHVLSTNHGKRIAVIQNEVSEQMGIESPAITDGEGNVLPDFYELPNGCICCSARDGLIVALERIIQVSVSRTIDAVLVETTGIADPQSVAQVFWVDSGMDSPLYLNGVITFIDSLNINRFLQGNDLDLGEIVTKQIACADALILNKTDLIDQQELDKVTQSVITLNTTAPLITTTFSAVPWDLLFNLNAFGSANQRIWDKTPHSHFHGIDHIFLKIARNSISPESVTRAVGELLWGNDAGEIYRCKGLFEFQNKWFSLQGVGELFEVTEAKIDEAKIDADHSGRFLFIGRNLDSNKISDVLR